MVRHFLWYIWEALNVFLTDQYSRIEMNVHYSMNRTDVYTVKLSNMFQNQRKLLSETDIYIRNYDKTLYLSMYEKNKSNIHIFVAGISSLVTNVFISTNCWLSLPRYSWNIVESGVKHHNTRLSNDFNLNYMYIVIVTPTHTQKISYFLN